MADSQAPDYEMSLLVDTKPQLLDSPQTVVLQMDDAEHRCRACAMRIHLGPHLAQWIDEDGAPYCLHAEPVPGVTHLYGPTHTPTRSPFTWCEDITIELDPDTDQVRVSIGLRGLGTVSLTARRVPDDHDDDLAGKLIVHSPCSTQDTKAIPGIPTSSQAYTIG